MMKTISLRDNDLTAELYREAAEVLEQDGLVCLPCGGTYRIVADLNSEKAVMNLFQSKHRTKNTPSLSFVADKEMLGRIVKQIDPLAQALIDKLWPGNLTILVDPELDLPHKVVKRIIKANGRLGVRIPASEVALEVVRTFGGPLLVSSANIERKHGAYSPAQVRKHFVGRVDLFFDAGDLPPAPHSTVVDTQDGEVDIVRAGAYSMEEIQQALGISS